MALSLQKPGTYVARYVYDIPNSVDLGKLSKAWETTVRAHPILRTRIMDKSPQGMLQVVLKNCSKLETAESLEGYLASDMENTMQLGTPLIRIAISGFSGEAKKGWFVITIHHALYDDCGLRVVLDDFEKAYLGALTVRPFKDFVQYCLRARTTESEDFWRSELADMNATFPWAPPSANYRPSATMSMERWINIQGQDNQESMSAFIKAGWSIVLSQYADSDEVLFGVTPTGRGGCPAWT